jgi:hypothetical protein
MNDINLPLIGLAGFKRSGKDTIARALVAHYGYHQAAFADALRREVHEIDGVPPVPDEMKDAPLPGRKGTTYRDLLIQRGMARRAEDPGYWIKALNAALCGRLYTGERVVISDVRLPNEMAWIKAAGGLIVWVRRDGICSSGHATEQDNSRACDFTIYNDGSHPAILAVRLVRMIGLRKLYARPQASLAVGT